ncbi:mannosyltransferase [Clarireedia jacksonii]
MHGTLLGWWWNRKILPWDSDSDVQVSEASMHYLASYYNMTVFHYKTPRIPEGRDYMLEINPHYINREQSDKLNVIDARWVDTTSGLFIDITTARYNYTHPAGEGMLSCKDGHEYRDTYIFPLRDTFFEGAPAKIPFAYKEVLEAEYHEKALTLTEYEGHRFDDDKLEWIPIRQELQKPIEAPKSVPKVEEKKPEPKVEQAKPEEVKKDVEATKQDNTGKDTKDTPPVSKPSAKIEKQQAHDSSERSPAQREADNKIFSAAEKKQQLVQTAEELRKANEFKAAEAKKKAEEKTKGEKAKGI